MNEIALFIKHQAHPGKRDEVQRIWEKHVKPRVESNPDHKAYFFCYDINNPDVICVFQLYTDMASVDNFLKGPWYTDYLNEISPFIALPPQINRASLSWTKK